MTPHVWVVEMRMYTGQWEPIKMHFTRDEARMEHRELRRRFASNRLRIVKYGRMA